MESKGGLSLLQVFVLFSLSANIFQKLSSFLPLLCLWLTWVNALGWIIPSWFGIIITPAKFSFALKRRSQELHLPESPLSYVSILEHVYRRNPWARVMERSLFSSLFQPELWVDVILRETSRWILRAICLNASGWEDEQWFIWPLLC